MSKPTLLSVILCGPGEELYPLTNTGISSSSTQSPVKPLLPVAGKPILEWVLDWLLAQGVEDHLVLASVYQQQALSSFIRHWKSHKNAKIDLQCIDEATAKEDEEGTAGALRWADRNGFLRCHNFILVPCDIFFSPSSPTSPQQPSLSIVSQLLSTHLSSHALITTVYYTRESGGILPERKGGLPEILIGMKASPERKSNLSGAFRSDDDLQERRLIIVGDSNKKRKRRKANETVDDGDEEEEQGGWEIGDDEDWAFRQGMVKKFSPLVVSTALLPSHVFLCTSRVLSILHAFPYLTSFREQALPLFCKMQWQPPLTNKGEENYPLQVRTSEGWKRTWQRSSTWIEEDGPLHVPNNVNPKDANTDPKVEQGDSEAPLAYSSFGRRSISRDNTLEGEMSKPPSVFQKVMILVWGKEQGFCRRGNEVQGYMEINRMALTSRLPIPNLHHPPGSISPDSVVSSGVVIGEKVMVKRSSVGKNCNISKGTKIIGCVIMENVSIGENVKLENCIICPGARVGANSTLKDCEIEAEFIVEPETNAKNDKLAT